MYGGIKEAGRAMKYDMTRRKITILDLQKRKEKRIPIAMLTEEHLVRGECGADGDQKLDFYNPHSFNCIMQSIKT